jgi:hypothetical protein
MEELKQKLLEVCNESGLPLEAIVFVTKDLWRDAEDTLRAAKANAKKKKQEQEKESKKQE